MTKRPGLQRYEPDLHRRRERRGGDGGRPSVSSRHLHDCAGCRDEYARYRAVDAAVAEWRATAACALLPMSARERLLARSPICGSGSFATRVFSTPLGPLLIATTEQGIALVEYVRATRRIGLVAPQAADRSRLEPIAAALERFHGELMDYLARRRTSLEWPLDFRFARSEFQRAGAAGDRRSSLRRRLVVRRHRERHRAAERGARRRRSALRRNPVPIVVPCHRIVGSNGALVGYSGSRIGLEGAPARRRRRARRASPPRRPRSTAAGCTRGTAQRPRRTACRSAAPSRGSRSAP